MKLIAICLSLLVAGCAVKVLEQDPKHSPAPTRIPKYLYKDRDIKAMILPIPRFQAGSVIEPTYPLEYE